MHISDRPESVRLELLNDFLLNELMEGRWPFTYTHYGFSMLRDERTAEHTSSRPISDLNLQDIGTPYCDFFVVSGSRMTIAELYRLRATIAPVRKCVNELAREELLHWKK